MEDVFNTPHTCKVDIEVLGHKLLLSQDPNSKHLGTTVWDSSFVFVKYLEKNSRKGEFCRAKLHGKRVVELGAGCGLSGLGMALLGCDVVVTDQVEVLPILLRNVERNMVVAKSSAAEYPHLGPVGSIQVAELDWGNHLQAEVLEPPFDYIVGTDLVYKEHLLPPLLESILALSGPKTTLLLGYEFRCSGVREQLRDLFSHHFEIKKIPHSKMDAKYQHPNIDLFIMRYKDSSMISSTQEPVDLKENSTSSKCDESDSDSDYPTNKDGCETSCNTLQSKIDLQPNEVKEVSDTDLKEVSRESHVRDWEAGRLGSMAARLLKNVRIPLDNTTKDDSELVCTKV